MIGVYSDEACTNQITTMTTGEDGSAGCALTRDYERIYLKELTAPAGAPMRRCAGERTENWQKLARFIPLTD